MARIKKSTNSIAPFVAATIGCAVFSIAFGPLIFLLWPVLFLAGKYGMGQDIDELTEKDTMEIIEEAKRVREPGQRFVTVKQTIPSGGSLVDLPMTRKWEVIFDDDD